jgi:hypothetical protein
MRPDRTSIFHNNRKTKSAEQAPVLYPSYWEQLRDARQRKSCRPGGDHGACIGRLQSCTDSEVILPAAMAGGKTGLVLCQVGGQ